MALHGGLGHLYPDQGIGGVRRMLFMYLPEGGAIAPLSLPSLLGAGRKPADQKRDKYEAGIFPQPLHDTKVGVDSTCWKPALSHAFALCHNP